MINASLLQMVINASNDGIVVAEKEGEQDNILIYVNPAFERLTGYTSEEILYQDCRFLQAGDRDQEESGADSRGLAQQRIVPGNPAQLSQGRHAVLERTVAFNGEKRR
jgi:PAS domain S-box-containing protein